MSGGGRTITIFNPDQCCVLMNMLSTFRPKTSEQKEVYERLKMGCPYTPDRPKRRTQTL